MHVDIRVDCCYEMHTHFSVVVRVSGTVYVCEGGGAGGEGGVS